MNNFKLFLSETKIQELEEKQYHIDNFFPLLPPCEELLSDSFDLYPFSREDASVNEKVALLRVPEEFSQEFIKEYSCKPWVEEAEESSFCSFKKIKNGE